MTAQGPIESIAHLPDGVVVFDPDTGTILRGNEAFATRVDTVGTELPGTHIGTIELGNDAVELGATDVGTYVERARRDGPVQFPWTITHGEDHEQVLDANLTVSNTSEGEVAFLTVRDPSPRGDQSPPSKPNLRAENGDRAEKTDRNKRTASEETERYRRILERSSDYVLLLDESGTITYVSPSVEPISGFDPETLLGTDAFEKVHPADVEHVKQKFEEKLSRTGDEVTVEYRIRTANGGSKWVEARGANYLDDPVVDGVLVTVREISTRKDYEEQLEAKNKLLERLTRIVAHDLRTPVSAAQKFVPILRHELDEPDEAVAETLDRLEGTLDTLNDFTEHIPRLAKEGTRVERHKVCDLEEIARDAWDTVETGPLSLVVPDSRRLEGDPQRIQQVFQNLFENVMNHADPRAETGAETVTVGTTTEGFFVEDDGPGIDGVSDEQAFDYGTTTAGDGSGIGLAIVRTIVEAHGWDIELTKGGDGGARFEITTENE